MTAAALPKRLPQRTPFPRSPGFRALPEATLSRFVEALRSWDDPEKAPPGDSSTPLSPGVRTTRRPINLTYAAWLRFVAE